MYLGEIVEIGPRAAIFENPQHAYTRKLLEAVPVPDPAARANRRSLAAGEVRNPIRPPDFVPSIRQYREVLAGYYVHVLGEEQAA